MLCGRVGEKHFTTQTVNEQACRRRRKWRPPQQAWRGEGFQQRLRSPVLCQRDEEGHFSMQILNK
jgi:hypothetical protein